MWTSGETFAIFLLPLAPSLFFPPVHSTMSLWECRMIKKAVFSGLWYWILLLYFHPFSFLIPLFFTAHFFTFLSPRCRLVAHALSSQACRFFIFSCFPHVIVALKAGWVCLIFLISPFIIPITQNTLWQAYWGFKGAMATQEVQEGFTPFDTMDFFKMNGGERKRHQGQIWGVAAVIHNNYPFISPSLCLLTLSFIFYPLFCHPSSKSILPSVHLFNVASLSLCHSHYFIHSSMLLISLPLHPWI